MAFRITSDGMPTGTRVFFNGEDVSRYITGVSWTHEANMATRATIEVMCPEIEVTGKREPEFMGLESVPVDALQQEIERRSIQARLEEL